MNKKLNNKHRFYHNGYYHVYNKVISERELFYTETDYIEFMRRYKRYFHNYLETYAYCLLPNHFHILLKVRSEEEIREAIVSEDTNAARQYLAGTTTVDKFLGNQLSRFFSGLVIRYNKKHRRQGQLFKQGVKKVALNSHRTIEQQMHYIHNNPVNHGIVSDAGNWEYSSYYAYISNGSTLMPREEVLNAFGGVDEFISFHQKQYDGDVFFD